MNDNDLLRRYAEQGDENAFAEVVRRNTDFVFSVALRVSNNRLLAEEVTQTVFTKLARQARLLGRYSTLGGWLHATTRNTAIDMLRSDHRRRRREQEAAIMQTDTVQSETIWDQLRPALDEAVAQLNPRDREVVLLRFFKGLSHQEVGAALGLSENAANKCSERALARLRANLNRGGGTYASVIVAESISAHSIQAAPPGLATKAAQGALAARAAAGTLGMTLWTIFYFMSTKTKNMLAGAMVVLLIAAIALKLKPSPAAVPATQSPPIAAPAPSESAPKASGITTAAAPAATDAAKPATSSPVDTSPTAVARRELNSTFDEIIALLAQGDAVKAADTFLSPGSRETMGPESVEMLKTQIKALQESPRGQQLIQKVIRSLKDMKTQSQTLSASGDRMSFQIRDPEDPTYSAPDVTFRKMDGKWYFIMAKMTD